MVQGLLICALLIWLPVVFYGAAQRGLVVVLLWVMVAPIAVNLIDRPGGNPFFKAQTEQLVTAAQGKAAADAYLGDSPGTVKFNDMLDPNRIVFGVFCLVLLGNTLLKRRRLGPFDRTEKFAAVFSLVLIASAFFQSRRSLFGLRIVADAFIIPFVAYFCIRRFVTNRDELHRFLQAIVCTGFVTLCIAIVERLVRSGLYARLSGPFNEPAGLQVITSLIFVVALCDSIGGWALANDRRLLPTAIRRFILYVAPVVIVMTWARATWLGFIGAFGVFVLLAWRSVHLSWKIAAIGLALTGIPVITLTYVATEMETVVKDRVTERTNTVYARLGAWKLTMEEFLEAPIFGIGMNNLRDVLVARRIYFGGVKSEDHSHNSFLSILAEQGAIGFLLYLGVMVSILQPGRRIYRDRTSSRDRLVGAAVCAIMAAYLIPAFFTNSLQLPSVHHVYVYGLMGGIASVYGRRISVSSAYTQHSLVSPHPGEHREIAA